MLKTFMIDRPYAVFTPSNAAHRKAYYEFIQNRSWAKCPYKFILEDTKSDLVSSINEKMAEYYLQREFRKSP